MLIQRMRKHGLQQSAHLRAVPLTRPEGHADGVAARAHDERRRQSGHAPRLRGFEVGVEQDGERQAETTDVGVEQRPRGVAVDGDAEDDEPAAAVLLPQRFERWHLGETRLAPRRPEIHDHELVPMIRQRRHATIKPRQPQPRRRMPLLQLRHPGPLERIQRHRRMRRMVPPILPRPPHRQSPKQSPDENQSESNAQELRPPAVRKPKARDPAPHLARNDMPFRAPALPAQLCCWGRKGAQAPLRVTLRASPA